MTQQQGAPGWQPSGPGAVAGHGPPPPPGYGPVRGYGPPPGYVARTAPPADEGLAMPVAIDPVPGTPFALAVVGLPAPVNGFAVASLVSGIGSILVTIVVICFAAVGGEAGWGALVAGAFAVLAGALGAASIVLGVRGRRQARRTYGPGGGVALAGAIVGGLGLVFTVIAMLIAVAASGETTVYY